MVDRGWQTTLIVDARRLDGGTVGVAVGLVGTQSGEQLALRVDGGDTLILPDQAAVQLAINILGLHAAKHCGDGGGWQTELAVDARKLDGTLVPVAVSIVSTQSGEQMTLRIDAGDTLILPVQAALQLFANIRELHTVKHRGDGGVR